MQFFKTMFHRFHLDKVLFAVIYVLGNVSLYKRLDILKNIDKVITHFYLFFME